MAESHPDRDDWTWGDPSESGARLAAQTPSGWNARTCTCEGWVADHARWCPASLHATDETVEKIADRIQAGIGWRKDRDGYFVIGEFRVWPEDMGRAWRIVALRERERAERAEARLRERDRVA